MDTDVRRRTGKVNTNLRELSVNLKKLIRRRTVIGTDAAKLMSTHKNK